MTATTQKASLIAQLTEIVRESAKISPRIAIHENSRLVEDLAIDSLDLVNLVLELQERFDVAIDEEALPKLCRIADVAAYLASSMKSNRN